MFLNRTYFEAPVDAPQSPNHVEQSEPCLLCHLCDYMTGSDTALQTHLSEQHLSASAVVAEVDISGKRRSRGASLIACTAPDCEHVAGASDLRLSGLLSIRC